MSERWQQEEAPGRPTDRKVVIVGAGMVGSTFAYALLISGAASDMVLVDINRQRAEGEAMDLNHGLPFVAHPVEARAGDFADCRGAAVVVVSAGVAQRLGETRVDLVRRNAEAFRQIIPRIREHAGPDTVLLVVTNPVDIMCYVAWRISGWEPRRVVGSGTVLDSARLRFLLSQHCRVDARSVHAYIIGEHGDTEVPAWSLSNIAGVPLRSYCPVCRQACPLEEKERIFEQVRSAAYQIIERKGATYYGIGLALLTIVQSILGDQNRVLTVSTLMQNMMGVDDVYVSLPCIVNRSGVAQAIPLPLSPEEEAAFRHSAQTLKDVIAALSLPPRGSG